MNVNCFSLYMYGYKNRGDFPKVTQAMYSDARLRTKNKLSKAFITPNPLVNVIRIPNASLNFEFPSPPLALMCKTTYAHRIAGQAEVPLKIQPFVKKKLMVIEKMLLSALLLFMIKESKYCLKSNENSNAIKSSVKGAINK